jgi:hypothetical protein
VSAPEHELQPVAAVSAPEREPAAAVSAPEPCRSRGRRLPLQAQARATAVLRWRGWRIATSAHRGCCARKSPRTRSPRSSRAGPASGGAAARGRARQAAALDKVLHERVIGQDEAVQLVATPSSATAPASRTQPPIGSFIFLGPTGVGKTELSRALAQALFDSEDNMIRLDMSE